MARDEEWSHHHSWPILESKRVAAQGRARVLPLSPKLVSKKQKITESASTRASPSAFGSGWGRTQGYSQKDEAETSTSFKGIDE